jgi:ribosomal protein S18 acetylase RimI-like enzyme
MKALPLGTSSVPAAARLDGGPAASDNGAVNAVHLQPARRDDAPRLAAMSRRLIESGLEPCWTAERIERQLRNHDSVVLTARAAVDIAGFAIMQYGDDAAHLNLLAVQPAYRRSGIGRQLVSWLEDTARVAGTFAIRLEVRTGNAAARAFYAALGYRETGYVRGYYQGVEDAIRLARDLAVARQATAR